jgi:aryl-alcohol dehydrogenase-like predicted oxidoreductase
MPGSIIDSLCAESRPLGTSSLSVGALGIGTAALSSPYGAPGAERSPPAATSVVRTLEHALQRGISFIDTAPAYGDAESAVGTACQGTDCRVATKLAIPEQGWETLSFAAIADHVQRSVHRSLKALQRDQIDLLQIHNADGALVARGDVPRALEALRGEKLVLACGATVYGEENALAAIECPVFDAVQIAYSALDRRPERMVLGAATEHATGLIVRSVLLRGVLSSAARDLGGAFDPLRTGADRFRVAIGATWEELPGAAVAFALTRPGISCTLLGPRDVDELELLLRDADRFLDSAREVRGDWDRGLTPTLLDPSRWTELD